MSHGVLDKRLNEQWRNAAIAAVGIDLEINFEPFAETDFLDIEKTFSQLSVHRQRRFHLLPALRLSQLRMKSASNRHMRRAATGIRNRQSADRVQAVKEEVRIDLRTKSSQLRFTRENLQPQSFLLLPSGGFLEHQ